MRHPALISLSHDHHHGLAMGLRLSQGEKALLTDGWTHEPAWQADQVARFYQDELVPHFRAEEEVLFPAVLAALPQQADLIKRLLGDHRNLAAQIDTLRTLPADRLGPVLQDIGHLLQDHIRAEERVLFPACETGLSPDVLDALARKLAGAKQNASPKEGGNPAAGGVVLLVEDEVEFRHLFALLLEAEGIEVVQAANGPEAMRALEQRGREIRLVVTDMNLPGTDGTLIASRTRETAPSAKILAMSGYGGADMRLAATEAGADEFMNKPFDPPRAVDTVKRLLGMT